MNAYEDECPDWTDREQTSALVLTAADCKSHVKTNVSDVTPSGKEGRRGGIAVSLFTLYCFLETFLLFHLMSV